VSNTGRPWRKKLPQTTMDPETVAVIICITAVTRVTGGNFHLLNQDTLILEINTLEEASETVVEAARERVINRSGLNCRIVVGGIIRTRNRIEWCDPGSLDLSVRLANEATSFESLPGT
jgi:hypothetical protein